jgi:hypothetical protein
VTGARWHDPEKLLHRFWCFARMRRATAAPTFV